MTDKIQQIALVGFANVGKSTLFNELCSQNQKVGNWSGVTVALKKSQILINNTSVNVVDLPGISSLKSRAEQGQDLTISQQFIKSNSPDLIVNVIDATQLKRQLVLTAELLALDIPMVVVINKIDRKEAYTIDGDSLAKKLGCRVVLLSGKEQRNNNALVNIVTEGLSDGYAKAFLSANQQHQELTSSQLTDSLLRDSQRQLVEYWSQDVSSTAEMSTSLTDKIDRYILAPYLGVPIFLCVMYLLFMFAINIGGAFIDFFDLLAGEIFVAYPLYYLSALNVPTWLATLVEGIGSGIQTVATFVPIIACLFIGLSILESSGYLARAAFVVDSLMQKIGLPGKAFVPLIVGFGCTVPAVMSARVLDSERERITTVMMAPFMSCGARLPVYALFAAAFFPENGQNLVFLLYLIGIVAAIFTGYLLKLTVLIGKNSINLMELPLYEAPSIRYILIRVWQRTAGFVTGAGKIIVIVVCCLHFANSIGTDGSFGHQDSQNSILSSSAKLVLPALNPIGIQEDNWPAGVGIITGIFAKEVLVATFNNLYSPQGGEAESEPSLADRWSEATDSILVNLFGLSPVDPLGMNVGEISDLTIASQEQEVALTTYQMMQKSFDGQVGAFSYLIFILLYTPCIAAMGAIKNEVGTRWTVFAGVWSFVLAYIVATLSYQIGRFSVQPVEASITICIALLVLYGIYAWLKAKGKAVLSIPTRVYYT